jgi:hypothetical protein
LTQGSGTIRWQATPGGGGAFVIQNNSNTGIFFTNSSSTLASLANTGNLLLGTTTDDGANRLQVAGQIGIIGASFGQINNAVGDLFITNNAAASALIVRVNGVEGMRVASTSRNVLIGGSTDGGFKIDIQNSGSSGTLRAYDQTPTTGATSVIVRAGAGQSTTDLTQFVTLSNGTSGVRSNGSIFGGTAVAIGAVGGSTNPFGVLLGSGADIRWSNAASFGGGTPDISLYRASANTLQVGDGGSNSNGLLYLKGVRPVGSTVATLPTASGNTGMIATVTDATVTTIGTTVAGGGGNTVLVWSNGTNWRIYAN